VAGQNNLDPHLGNALHYRVEVFHLEPEQHTIAVGSVSAIADWAVMVSNFKAVQLQDKATTLHQLLILLAAVSPTAAQQALIPTAAGFDVSNTNKRLGVHNLQDCSDLGEWIFTTHQKPLASPLPPLLFQHANRLH